MTRNTATGLNPAGEQGVVMAETRPGSDTERQAEIPPDQASSIREIADPHKVAISTVDGVSYANVVDGVCILTMVASQFTPIQGAGNSADVVVTARLRFNLSTARTLRDILDRMILSQTKVEGQAN